MRRIRNSAKALIIKDGKMAAIKIRDAGEEWYIMPGGGQEAEETLNEAVCREVSEELGIAIECKELLFVVEGVHGETFHRVDLIFSCEYIDNMPDAVLHGDTNQVGIGWLDISTLNLQPLYPSKLRRQIMNYYQGKPYKVYLGNEEAGDPECPTGDPIKASNPVCPEILSSIYMCSFNLVRYLTTIFHSPDSRNYCNHIINSTPATRVRAAYQSLFLHRAPEDTERP